jgi:predicted transcriptional regulator
MGAIVDLTANIVAAHAGATAISTKDLLAEIQLVYNMLDELENIQQEKSEGRPRLTAVRSEAPEPVSDQQLTCEAAFSDDEVVCLVCGKRGMKTLSRHLTHVHGMSQSAYRDQFSIPRSQPLTAKSFSSFRSGMAKTRTSDTLAVARAARARKLSLQYAEQAEKLVNGTNA